MDIEKLSKVELENVTVNAITDKCNQLKSLREQIEQEEEKISLLKSKARDFEERIIPEMMQEAGVEKLSLKDGTQVEIKPFYAAKIPESRVEEAFSWLRSNGHEDLIKNTITTQFDKGQDNQVSELISVCEKFGFNYNQKQKVESKFFTNTYKF